MLHAQDRCIERLTQEAKRAARFGLAPQPFFRMGGDEDGWKIAAPLVQRVQQINAAHSRHLNIRDETDSLLKFLRTEKFFS